VTGRQSTLYLPRTPSGQSGGVLVFVEDASQAVVAVDVHTGELVGDRFGQRLERPNVRDPRMRSVEIVEPLILPQCR